MREILAAALASNDKVRIDFDGTAMAPASFLEEVFGGLARDAGENDEAIGRVRARIEVVCNERPVVCTQALRYFDEAKRSK
nr:STAS-like domain-containing protein [Phenylobacterium glaciei]